MTSQIMPSTDLKPEETTESGVAVSTTSPPPPVTCVVIEHVPVALSTPMTSKSPPMARTLRSARATSEKAGVP